MPAEINERQATASSADDLFVELFGQVFSIERLQMLASEYPIEEIEGISPFIDVALRTAKENIAFEIDGVNRHVPDPEREI